MDQSLRVLFDRALGDEPLPPPGDLAQEAMTHGRRLRRRRLTRVGGGAAGVAAALAAVLALNVAKSPPPTPPSVMSLAMMSLAMKPDCTQAMLASAGAVVFLRYDITDQHRANLDLALRTDPRVRTVEYQSKESAYAKFKLMYRDAPDLVGAVRVEQLPESFHVTLVRASVRAAFVESAKRMPGVEAVVAEVCASSSGETE